MREPHVPSPSIDDDGVRVFERRPARNRRLPFAIPAATLAAVGGIAWWVASMPSDAAPARATFASAAAGGPAVAPTQRATVSVVPRPPSDRGRAEIVATPPDPVDWPSGDPRDLASHFRPGDPVPTAAELILALQESGDHTGLGAFNPPGTAPPLHGLAVPPDFVLPPGYVRHHQVTDDGVPLEPILMYAPDFAAVDANGIAADLPQDRVVPPELAPPGLPLRAIDIPDP